MAPRDTLTRIPPEIATPADYAPYARERMDDAAWTWLTGGAGDGRTARRNAEAYDDLLLTTRLLRDMSAAHTRLELFGRALDHPILLAPIASHRLFHPDGEMATAAAAAAMGAPMVVSTQANHRIEDIAAQPGANLWFQLYLQPDREFTVALVGRAEAAGYQALVLTADAPVGALRAGLALPGGVVPVNLEGMRPLPPHHGAPGQPPLFGSDLVAAAPTWADIAWLRGLTPLPILLKGVMTPEDAARAIDEGLDGVIVSNHGGRILDGQPAAIEALPGIAEAVARRVPVLLDGGIRCGGDIFRALALGADAVLVGRLYMLALAAAGAPGVAHVIHLLRAELEATMIATGCATLAEIESFLVRR
ncbi:MAG: alpha-hydroxy-acid oxidizing protein [Sphingomonas sp.]|nr:alpha-hydroxy-acid oxidizing protein [Sphingomonas sp.]